MKTTLTIDEDGVLTFPPEMLEELGWKEGDVLEWIEYGNNAVALKKVNADE